MSNTIVLATLNHHKVTEIQKIIDPAIEVVSLAEVKPEYEDIEETGQSFQENALIKGRAAFQATQLPAVADDSGLEIHALDGAPGIYSSRFEKNDELRIRKVLDLLKDTPWQKRQASFRCVVCYYESEENYHFFEGIVNGLISFTPLGDSGFGYDPIFYHPPSHKTFAQLEPDVKNQLSHRADAFRKFNSFLQKDHQE